MIQLCLMYMVYLAFFISYAFFSFVFINKYRIQGSYRLKKVLEFRGLS